LTPVSQALLVRTAHPVPCGLKEQIASLQGFRGTAYYLDKWNTGWFGLTPDNRPITTRDTGIEELYAFDLEYK
jgi:hypothetical protein